MRSQARLLVGLIVSVAVIWVSADAYALGRRKPLPDPVPSASPCPQPSPAPSTEPSPVPSPSPLPPLPIQLGQIAVGGTGCPAATTEVIPSTDLRTYTIKTAALFAALQPGATLARVACSVAIPVAIPAGTRLIIAEASAAGSYSLARAASGKASLEAFFAGQMSDAAVLPVGSAEASTLGALDLIKENAALGACGADEIVRLNTSLFVTQPASSTEASSLGFATLQLKLELAPCDEQL